MNVLTNSLTHPWSAIGALGIYVICWWLVLFTVLPFRIKTQQETRKIVPGSAPSAPQEPNIKAKMIITTLLAFLPLIGIILASRYKIFTLDDLDIFGVIMPNNSRIGDE